MFCIVRGSELLICQTYTYYLYHHRCPFAVGRHCLLPVFNLRGVSLVCPHHWHQMQAPVSNSVNKDGLLTLAEMGKLNQSAQVCLPCWSSSIELENWNRERWMELFSAVQQDSWAASFLLESSDRPRRFLHSVLWRRGFCLAIIVRSVSSLYRCRTNRMRRQVTQVSLKGFLQRAERAKRLERVASQEGIGGEFNLDRSTFSAVWS